MKHGFTLRGTIVAAVLVLTLTPGAAVALDCNNPPQGFGSAWWSSYASWCTQCGGTANVSNTSCTPGSNWGGQSGSSSSTPSSSSSGSSESSSSSSSSPSSSSVPSGPTSDEMRLDSKSRVKAKLGYEDVPAPDNSQIQTTKPGAMYSRKLNQELLTPLKQCKRNLEHRQALLDRIEKLSNVYEKEVARKGEMAGLVQNEDFIRKSVFWDGVEGAVSAGSVGLGKYTKSLVDNGKLTAYQAGEIGAAANGLSTILAAGRPTKDAQGDSDAAMDAANNLQEVMLNSGLAALTDDKTAEAIISITKMQFEVVKATQHLYKTGDAEYVKKSVEEAINIAGAAYKPITVIKGGMSVAMGTWYWAATRGNLKSMSDALAMAQKAEIILFNKIKDLQDKVSFYQNDVALCGP